MVDVVELVVGVAVLEVVGAAVEDDVLDVEVLDDVVDVVGSVDVLDVVGWSVVLLDVDEDEDEVVVVGAVDGGVLLLVVVGAVVELVLELVLLVVGARLVVVTSVDDDVVGVGAVEDVVVGAVLLVVVVGAAVVLVVGAAVVLVVGAAVELVVVELLEVVDGAPSAQPNTTFRPATMRSPQRLPVRLAARPIVTRAAGAETNPSTTTSDPSFTAGPATSIVAGGAPAGDRITLPFSRRSVPSIAMDVAPGPPTSIVTWRPVRSEHR